jgi:hypothetical protein
MLKWRVIRSERIREQEGMFCTCPSMFPFWWREPTSNYLFDIRINRVATYDNKVYKHWRSIVGRQKGSVVRHFGMYEPKAKQISFSSVSTLLASLSGSYIWHDNCYYENLLIINVLDLLLAPFYFLNSCLRQYRLHKGNQHLTWVATNTETYIGCSV